MAEHTPGTVRHIDTGEVLHHTDSLEETFLKQVRDCLAAGKTLFVVGGRFQGKMQVLKEIEEMNVPVIQDDDTALEETMLIFEGQPEEWDAELKKAYKEYKNG